MKTFIHIETTKFPIMENEKEELVNDGFYGKALSIYLKEKLTQKGYDVPSFFCEDWGWWINIKTNIINLGICIYNLSPPELEPTEYVCCTSIKGERKWIWGKFKFIETKAINEKIVNEIVQIFKSDKEIKVVEITEDFPLK